MASVGEGRDHVASAAHDRALPPRLRRRSRRGVAACPDVSSHGAQQSRRLRRSAVTALKALSSHGAESRRLPTSVRSRVPAAATAAAVTEVWPGGGDSILS